MPPALTWFLLVASLIVGLAALVRMAGPVTGGFEDITGVIRLPERVTLAIVALFVLAALVFLLDLARRMRARRRDAEGAPGPEPARVPPWLRALAQIVSLANFVVFAYLLWRSGISFVNMMPGGIGGSAGVPGLEHQLPAPALVTWTFGILALVAGLGALALALWVAFGDRLVEWWERPAEESPPSPVAEAVEESLEDLRAEPDARRAIIRCYARFERAAADSGLARKPWLTPMEFMREALERLPVPRGAVPTLTGLFELARFSRRALGRPERDRALDALDAIKVAIDEGRADAVAR